MIQFGMNFITEYYPIDSHKPVRNIEKITKRYLNMNFKYDFVALLPLQIIKFKYSKVLFLVKTIRLQKALMYLDYSVFMKQIKGFY